jgi:drug/metabolite transporter (DMT)-like permease
MMHAPGAVHSYAPVAHKSTGEEVDAAEAALVAASTQPASASSSQPTDEKTALVRSMLVQRADAVIEMGESAELVQAESDQVVAPVAFSPAPSAAPSVGTAPRPKLSIGNFLETYIPPRVLGISYLAISAVIFSIQALFVSLVSQRMPSFQIVMFRCILQFGLSLFYFAISHLTLADATTIFFTAPLYTGILGFIFLGEAVAKFDMACTVASVFGVIMVVRPVFLFGATDSAASGVSTADGNGSVDANDPNVNTGSFHTAGIVAAIVGSLVSSFVYVAIRKVGPGVHPLVLVTYMGLVGMWFAPFGGLAQTFNWPADGEVWISLLMIGLLSFVGQMLFNAGVQREKAGPASMIRNLDVAFSFVWQVVIEGIVPNVWSVFGALIISASVVAMGIKKWRAEAPRTPPPTTTTSPPIATDRVDETVIELPTTASNEDQPIPTTPTHVPSLERMDPESPRLS